MSEGEKVNDVVELLKSARADILNNNFIAAVEAINVALDEIATIEAELCS